jgi:hypothetical protein
MLNCEADAFPPLLSSVREIKEALAPDLSIEFVASDGVKRNRRMACGEAGIDESGQHRLI